MASLRLRALGGHILGACLVALAAAGCVRSPEQPTRVIWICVDSLRADHLHYAGYPRETSPWLDALAARSADFRSAVAAGDGTHLSVPAFLTGKFFSQIHAKPSSSRGIPEAYTTIAEALAQAGFRSRAWSANIVTKNMPGLAQGMDRVDNLCSTSRSKISVDEMIAAITSQYQPTGGREFLYFHLMDVHLPYLPPTPYDQMFTRSDYTGGRVKYGAMRNERNEYICSTLPLYPRSGNTYEGTALDSSDIEQLIGLYDGAIRYLDARLPALLEALAYDPERDLLILSADHGEQFYEYGFWGHCSSTLAPEIRVPLLIAWNGFQAGARIEAVSLLDIFPTLCDLFGVPPPDRLAGESLLPVLKGAPQSPRSVICEGYYSVGAKASVFDGRYLYQLQESAHKLSPDALWPYREMLFDLEADPLCFNDIFADQIERADAMNAFLRQTDRQFEALLPEKIRGTDGDLEWYPNGFDFPGTMSLPADPPAPPAQPSDGSAPVLLTFKAPQFVLTGHAEHTSRVHRIEFSYRLPEGRLKAELRYRDSGKMFWRCDLATHSPKWRFLTAAVVPQDSKEVELVVTLLESGQVELKDLYFARYIYPAVQLTSWADHEDAIEEPPPSPSEEDSEQLKALGYL